MSKNKTYDVVVVGGGHAGCEAALASSRMGCVTALITMHLDTIGLMSCNPAIGGVGKGQLVKEIDALGGQMAKAADACGIQFRILNASKGPAVQSSRAQQDRRLYASYMQKTLRQKKNLYLIEGEGAQILKKNGKVTGIKTHSGEVLYSEAVIITPGTFLRGLIHLGLNKKRAGRIGERPSDKLSQSLKGSGLKLERLKTCTPPRIDGKTVEFLKMKLQPGDRNPRPFSFSTDKLNLKQLPCYLTYTNQKTHKIIKNALKNRKLYHIISRGKNPRYCPSIEEKVMRFPQKERHQLFIEPEGLDTDEYYANGLFTFLPPETQQKLLNTIPGLEKAKITKFGYGIEYDFAQPTQLYPTLETKVMRNLYLAGQINGTTGYEEAACQGLIAGINAALKLKGRPPFILNRASSYIGVLIDDLVTKGTDEPYRMFTSRVEYRLLLREDNADSRLRRFGFDLGLVSKQDYQKTLRKKESIQSGLKYLKDNRISDNGKTITLYQFLKRPQIRIEDLRERLPFAASIDVLKGIETEVKYSGFIQRQFAQVRSFRNLEKIKIPDDIDYNSINGLSGEIKEKLTKFRPISLGQASRISGVTPAAIMILMVYLKKYKSKRVNPCLK